MKMSYYNQIEKAINIKKIQDQIVQDDPNLSELDPVFTSLVRNVAKKTHTMIMLTLLTTTLTEAEAKDD